MRKLVALAILGASLVLSLACVVSGPRIAPPPPSNEIVPVRPHPDYVWTSGYWRWTGGRYVWIVGSWVNPRPGHAWVPGHWENRGPRWIWRPGHWRRF
jgi:hypothetical protein